MDASQTTSRRKNRTLFANRVVQQTTFDKGWKNHIILENGVHTGAGAMTYGPNFYDITDGAVQTTSAELEALITSVPNKFPNPPTNVTAALVSGNIVVSFTAPIYQGITPVTSYTVISNPGNIQVNGVSSPITVTGLTSGLTYTFTVIANNTAGNSEPSEPSNAVETVTVPDAPTSVAATAGDSQATITFTAPVNDGGAAITSYTVTSTPGGFTSSGPVSPLTVTGLINGTEYTFAVVATNSVGNSEPSESSNSITPNPLTLSVFRSGSGTFTIPSGITSINYLVVGGGGGGGAGAGTGAGGGGGGGSVKTGTLLVNPGDVINYIVGNGGAGGTTPGGGETNGEVGEDTVFGTITAKGGGLGYRSRETNETAVYGRGGAAQSGDTSTTGGSGGNVRDGGGNPDQGAGGGGGGAGGAGVTSTSNGTDNNRGGAGGPGVNSDLEDGTTKTYGAGGKGADEGTAGFIGTLPGANGAVNTGKGGGGGASHSGGGNAAIGGNGGSGIIVLSYSS
jgi:hypothetical protein